MCLTCFATLRGSSCPWKTSDLTTFLEKQCPITSLATSVRLRLAEAAPGLLDQSAAWPERQTQLLETLFTDERQLDDADALLGEGGVVLLKQGFNASTRTCSVEY